MLIKGMSDLLHFSTSRLLEIELAMTSIFTAGPSSQIKPHKITPLAFTVS